MKKLAGDIPGSIFHPCNVSKDEEITEFFAQVKAAFGTIDFVIHSIAFAQREDLVGKFINTSRENFLLAIDVSAYSLVGGRP